MGSYLSYSFDAHKFRSRVSSSLTRQHCAAVRRLSPGPSHILRPSNSKVFKHIQTKSQIEKTYFRGPNWNELVGVVTRRRRLRQMCRGCLISVTYQHNNMPPLRSARLTSNWRIFACETGGHRFLSNRWCWSPHELFPVWMEIRR